MYVVKKKKFLLQSYHLFLSFCLDSLKSGLRSLKALFKLTLMIETIHLLLAYNLELVENDPICVFFFFYRQMIPFVSAYKPIYSVYLLKKANEEYCLLAV